MIEALKRAIELAQQLPEEEQQVLAQLMLEEMQAEARWEELFNDPRSEILLERMAEEERGRVSYSGLKPGACPRW